MHGRHSQRGVPVVGPPSVTLAIVASTVCAVTQGVLVAALVSLLVRRCLPLRNPVMALNGVGQNA